MNQNTCQPTGRLIPQLFGGTLTVVAAVGVFAAISSPSFWSWMYGEQANFVVLGLMVSITTIVLALSGFCVFTVIRRCVHGFQASTEVPPAEMHRDYYLFSAGVVTAAILAPLVWAFVLPLIYGLLR